MEFNYMTVIATIINFSLLATIIFGLYKAVQSYKSFIIRNKELDKKVDIILDKLDNQCDNQPSSDL